VTTNRREGVAKAALLHRGTPDYTCWVVSDLGLTELRDFAGLLEQAHAAAAQSTK
jgi:hypothetical protein